MHIAGRAFEKDELFVANIIIIHNLTTLMKVVSTKYYGKGYV